MTDRELLTDVMRQGGFSLTEEQTDQFLSYFALLSEWNKRMNLTAITEPGAVFEKHFLDSLLLAKHIDFISVSSLIDVGTGAGFPGIPLRILFPHLQLTLLDALDKRVCFLNEVIHSLSLSGAVAIHARAEVAGRNPDLREHFDLALARAVAPLPVLLEYGAPFVRLNGCFAAYKGSIEPDEMKSGCRAATILSLSLEKTVQERLPFEDSARTFLLFRKTSFLSEKYPRRDGVPGKRPL